MSETSQTLDYEPTTEPQFKRSLGAVAATAVNMTQMCGIGPFLTIPLAIEAMHGPQAMIGWLVGALLVMCDGLVWAELGAAMPGAGGTYLYLREAFQYRTGRLMPFLFVWTAMIFIPLIMSTGVIGIINYLGYFFPKFTPQNVGSIFWIVRGGVSVLIVAVVVFALYRNVKQVGRLATALWIVMFITVAAVLAASFTHFDAKLAFDFPPGAFTLNRGFFMGLGGALVIAVYDYLGYNTTAYMAAELREPGRTIPRSIVFSIVGMMIIYLIMNIGIIGVVPWRQTIVAGSPEHDAIASVVVERSWGPHAAQVVTGLIILTAFGSLFTGLLGGSRVPYNAARDRVFVPIFGRLHKRESFPHVALLAMGVVTAAGTFFTLDDVINALTAVMVLIQCISQILALLTLRSRQPTLHRPYRMILFPLPAILALLGWCYVYYATINTEKYGYTMIWASVGWVVLGVIAFGVWAMIEQTWPFGPKEIREEFLSAAAEQG
jgi:amino acid transporter